VAQRLQIWQSLRSADVCENCCGEFALVESLLLAQLIASRIAT
jgi:hypothetical protein